MAVKSKSYQRLLDKLPRLPIDESPDRQKRVDAIRDAILLEDGGTLSAPALVHRYKALRDAKDAAEAVVKQINEQLDAVTSLMEVQFEAEGVESLRTKDALVSIYVEPYTSVQDHDALREWCITHGLSRSLQLPWQTVNSLTKQRLEDGLPAPNGVTIYAKTKIRLERAK